MGWFKVDDQLAFHQKAVIAGNAAMGLWVRAGSWSCAQLTDGFIAKAMANAMANECDADALVLAGLWDEVEGGYQFHDWAEFQPSAEDEREKRKARSLAGKKGAAARWSNKTDGKPHGKSHGKNMRSQCPDPDPDPIKNSSSEVDKSTPRPDVENLLNAFDKNMESNGAKKPTRSKANMDALRLLIDKDGYSTEQILWIMNWAANDEFWRTNILSPAKLREKFDQLKLKAGVQPSAPKPLKGFDF